MLKIDVELGLRSRRMTSYALLTNSTSLDQIAIQFISEVTSDVGLAKRIGILQYLHEKRELERLFQMSDRMLVEYPGCITLRITVAMYCHSHKLYEKESSYLVPLLEMLESYPDLLLKLRLHMGKLRYELDQYADVIRYLVPCVESPLFTSIYGVCLAESYHYMDQVEESERYYRQFVVRFQYEPFLCYRYGQRLIENDRFNALLELIQHMKRRPIVYPDAYILESLYHMNQNDYVKMVRCYHQMEVTVHRLVRMKVIQISKYWDILGVAYYNFALTYLKMKQEANAIGAYEKSLFYFKENTDRDPSYHKYYWMIYGILLKIYLVNSQIDKAHRLYREYMQTHPDPYHCIGQIHYSILRYLIQTEQIELAVQLVHQMDLTQLHLYHTSALIYATYIAWEHGRIDMSKEFIVHIMNNDPRPRGYVGPQDWYEFYSFMSSIYAQQNDHEIATKFQNLAGEYWLDTVD